MSTALSRGDDWVSVESPNSNGVFKLEMFHVSAEAPAGDQVVYVNQHSTISQVLAEVLADNTDYTRKVLFGVGAGVGIHGLECGANGRCEIHFFGDQ